MAEEGVVNKQLEINKETFRQTVYLKVSLIT
jgi:hypothetical protein